MKKTTGLVLFCLSSLISYEQTYIPTDAGSEVKFVIRNFGINTGGTFEGLNGKIQFDPNNLSSSYFEVSVDASTVDTDIEARDNHLRRAEYFDAKTYPKLSFKSSRISRTNNPAYYFMFGTLSIKGVTKEIKFPFKANPKDGGYLFEGDFDLNRRDFGVGGKSLSLSDDLHVELKVFAKKS